MKKHLKVSAIKDGTVIDHIPAERLFDVIKILQLDNCKHQITFGTNLESKKLNKKAIIKISGRFFEPEEIDKISLIAHQATINIIKDYQVVEKKLVQIPDSINGIVKCFNPMCITNHEKVMPRFSVVSKEPLELKCYYCEKITDEAHIEIL